MACEYEFGRNYRVCETRRAIHIKGVIMVESGFHSDKLTTPFFLHMILMYPEKRVMVIHLSFLQ